MIGKMLLSETFLIASVLRSKHISVENFKTSKHREICDLQLNERTQHEWTDR